jgi:protoheme IX farnesyltransferase
MTHREIIDVFKLRIGALMALTAVAGYVVTPGIRLSSLQLLLLALVVLGASAAAGAFNQFAEHDLDAKMARTAKRAFVTGAATPDNRWLALIGALLLVSVALGGWAFNLAVAFHVFMGAFVYGVVYTLWLKRRTPLNIVIGGAAGSFAVLAGAAAADPGLGPESALLAVVLFLWTPPHFWALAIVLHDDYARAGVPMLPVVKGDAAAARIILINTVVLAVVSLLPFLFGMGWIYLAGALTGGGYFVFRAAQLVQSPTRKAALQCFVASLVQLSLVLLTAMADVAARM